MRATLALLLLTMAILAGQALFSRTHAKTAGGETMSTGAVRFEYQGGASCASTACHNGDALTGYRGREYKLVLERFHDRLTFRDKHQQAYETLLGERSLKILKNLHPDKPTHELRPERDLRCLRCHVHPNAADLLAPSASEDAPRYRLNDAVSCEACHGPAQHWLAEHFRPEWKHFDRETKQAHGMLDSTSIVGRLKTCVRCHIGEPGMDVNHDLLAAGHPRLTFDAAGHHAAYPRHWHPAKDTDPTFDPRGRPTFEAELWALGRLVSAEAALRVLAARAADDKAAPWPEFAEYRCASCHQDLSKGRLKPLPGTQAGQLPLSTLHFQLVPEALDLLALDSAPWRRSFAELSREMSAPLPDRTKITQRARLLATQLGEHLRTTERRLSADKLDAFTTTLTKQAAAQAADWESSYIYYHALAAQERTRADLRRPPLSSSPVAKHRPHVAKPESFDPNAWRRWLESIKDR